MRCALLAADGGDPVAVRTSTARAQLKIVRDFILSAPSTSTSTLPLPNVDRATLVVVVDLCEAAQEEQLDLAAVERHFRRGKVFEALPRAVVRCFERCDKLELCARTFVLMKIILAAVYLDASAALLLGVAKLLDVLRSISAAAISAAFARSAPSSAASRTARAAERRLIARNRWLRPPWTAIPSPAGDAVTSAKLEALLVAICARTSDPSAAWARTLGVGAPSLLGLSAAAQLERLVLRLSPKCHVVWGSGVGVVRSATSERAGRSAAQLLRGGGGWWSATKVRRGAVERLQLAFATPSLVHHIRLKTARRGQEIRVALLVMLPEPSGALKRAVLKPWTAAARLEISVDASHGLAAGLEVEVRHCAAAKACVGLDELVVLGQPVGNSSSSPAAASRSAGAAAAAAARRRRVRRT